MIFCEKQFRHFWLLVLTTAGICLLIGVIAFSHARKEARRSECTNNLKQIWLALDAFAWDHEHFYPRIDDTKGNFIFEGSLIFPKYLQNIEVLGCPADSGYERDTSFWSRKSNSNIRVSDPEAITSESYVYLGWVVANEKEGLAAIDAYLKLFNGQPKKNLRPLMVKMKTLNGN